MPKPDSTASRVDLENVYHRVNSNLALLIRLPWVESIADCGGTEKELQDDVWSGPPLKTSSATPKTASTS